MISLASPRVPAMTSASPSTTRNPTEVVSSTWPQALGMVSSSDSTGWACAGRVVGVAGEPDQDRLVVRREGAGRPVLDVEKPLDPAFGLVGTTRAVTKP